MMMVVAPPLKLPRPACGLGICHPTCGRLLEGTEFQNICLSKYYSLKFWYFCPLDHKLQINIILFCYKILQSITKIFFSFRFLKKECLLLLILVSYIHLYYIHSYVHPKKHFSYIICRRPNLQKWPRIMSAMPDPSSSPLFRNKRFALNEMFQGNTSKFSIFNV